MNTDEKIKKLFEKIKSQKNFQSLDKLYDMDVGEKFILMYLSDNSNEDIYAKTISDKLNISRARVAVLLKKMQNKGYISKVKSKYDSRIEIVKLNDFGFNKLKEDKIKIMNNIEKIIKEIGYKKFNDYIDLSIKIRKIVN